MHCKNWKTILPFAITFLIGATIPLDESKLYSKSFQTKEIKTSNSLSFEMMKFSKQPCQDNYHGIELDKLFKAKNIIESKIRFLKAIDSKSNELIAYQEKREDISKHIENKIRMGNNEPEIKGLICVFPGKLCDEE